MEVHGLPWAGPMEEPCPCPEPYPRSSGTVPTRVSRSLPNSGREVLNAPGPVTGRGPGARIVSATTEGALPAETLLSLMFYHFMLWFESGKWWKIMDGCGVDRMAPTLRFSSPHFLDPFLVIFCLFEAISGGFCVSTGVPGPWSALCGSSVLALAKSGSVFPEDCEPLLFPVCRGISDRLSPLVLRSVFQTLRGLTEKLTGSFH